MFQHRIFALWKNTLFSHLWNKDEHIEIQRTKDTHTKKEEHPVQAISRQFASSFTGTKLQRHVA